MKTIREHLFIITIITTLIIIIVVLLLKLKLNKTSCVSIYEEPEITKEEGLTKESPEMCTIDIKGAIKKPGVYTVDCYKNVNDAILLADGLTEEADTSNINLAKQITNEMVIIIHTKNEINDSVEKDNNIENQIVINNDSIINNNLININTASKEELKSLPGIGETRAKAIIEYRTTYGNFKDIEDIINVKGIGASLYEQIKIYITT